MEPHMDIRTGIFDDPVEFGCLWMVTLEGDQCEMDREDTTEWFCAKHLADGDADPAHGMWQDAAAERYADEIGLV